MSTFKTMKLKDLVDNIDKSKANQGSDFYIYEDEFSGEVDFYNISYDEADTIFKAYYVHKWICTDTWVGTQLLFMNDKFVGISFQSARKSDIKIYFKDTETKQAVKNKLLELSEAETEEIEPLDMDSEIEVEYNLSYPSQVIHDNAIYKDENVIVKSIDRPNYIVRIQKEDGSIEDVEISKLKFFTLLKQEK